ncbi:MAG TPA: hypothetical protein VGO07_01015, partial [Candidatus Saccharimonadales bacterium]|nr:hypothetical protein [Candidatus Saccharimonadales bacterium]
SMVRDVTASTAGQNLTLAAGGAVNGGTDLQGGDLILSGGISTGTGFSNIQFQTYPAGSTGTSDNTAVSMLKMFATGSATSGQGTLNTTLKSTAGSGTDKNGGNLTLSSGISTGTGSSSMNFKVYGAGSTGSTANASTTAMAIASNGNVGIGTGTPLGTLDVEGGTAAASTDGTGIILQAQGGGSGNKNGGTVQIISGVASGSGTDGNVVIDGKTGEVSIGGQYIVMLGQASASNYDTTAYASIGTTTAFPGILGDFTVGNNSGTPGTMVTYLMEPSNGSGNNYAYMGAISPVSGYTPAIVFGQQTGATAYAERMRIDESGNIGIGTANPQAPFEICCGTAHGAYITVKNSETELYEADAQQELILNGDAAGTYNLRLYTDSGGNGSILTTADMYIDAGLSNCCNELFLGNGTANISLGGGSYSVYIGNSGSMTDIGGIVGIGTATPQHLFDVNGNIGLAASSYINFGSTDGTSGYGIRDNGGIIECKNSSGSWAGCAGTASGTVNSGTQYQMGYYATSGTAISGDSNITTDASNDLIIGGGTLAVGTTTVTNAINIGGQAAKTISMVRDVTASTAGQNLTLAAGGATNGGTDLLGGDLILSGGISTGTGFSNVQFQTYPAGSTGTSDNTAVSILKIFATGSATSGQGTLNTTLKSTAGSGTDKNGASLTLASGISTGTGTSGLNFQVYGAGSTGSTANTATTAMSIASNGFVGIGSTTPVASLDLSQKTDAVVLPVGTTGQEPGSPIAGMLRYNSTTPALETYYSGAWNTVTTGGAGATINLGASAAATNPRRSGQAGTGFYTAG